MSECSEPGRPAHAGIGLVVNSQYAPDGVLVQVKTESQVDLLSDSRTSLPGIALLHFYDGIDDFLGWSLRAWLFAATRRIEQAILTLLQCVVKM